MLFSKDFGKDFSKQFDKDKDFDKDFGKEFSKDFGKDFSKDVGNDFAKDFGNDFSKEFDKDFDKDFGKEFGKDFSNDFRKNFVSAISNYFYTGSVQDASKTSEIDCIIIMTSSPKFHSLQKILPLFQANLHFLLHRIFIKKLMLETKQTFSSKSTFLLRRILLIKNS